MFESVRPPDAAERLRGAAAAPFAALLVALLYFTLYPTFTRVPPALFWSIDAILLIGAVIGAILIARILVEDRRSRLSRQARLPVLHVITACLVVLVCARLWLALTFPWL